MARRRSRKKPGSRRTLGKWLAIGGLALLVLIVVGGFGLYLALRSYLHSDRFRGMLAGELGKASESEGEFADFSWNGTTAYTDWFKARGYPEAKFSRIRADGIKTRVNFGAVRRGVWEIGDLDVERVNLLLESTDRLARPAVFDESIPESSGSGGRGLFSAFIPDRVELVRAGVAEFNFNAALGEMLVTGRGTALEIEPTGNEQVYRVSARRGALRIPGQPRLDLQEAELRAGGGGAIIDRADLALHDSGSLGVSGRVNMPAEGRSNLDLDILLRELPADRVLPEDWIKRLKGTIEADAEVTGWPGAAAPADMFVTGEARLLGGVLEAMPVLERIDEMLGSSKFRRLAFSDFKMRFEHRGERLALTDYYALSSGSACLKGRADLPMAGGETGGPTGRYMLGITADTIKWLPLIKKQIIEGVFKYDRDAAFGLVFGARADGIDKPPEGFRWAVADIDPGSLDPYTADLRSQFFGVGGMAVWAELAGVSRQGVEALELIASSAREQGLDALAILAEGAGEDGMFSAANLIRTAERLGVANAMRKILDGVIDGAAGLPGTIIDAGTGLLNKLPFP